MRLPLKPATFCTILLCPVIFLGCATAGYKKSSPACIDDYVRPAETDVARDTRVRALQHPAYHLIPFQRNQMYFCDPRHLTWFFFGNDADGIFGEGMAVEHPYSTNINWLTWFRWDVTRNPAHNMLFYPPLGSACFKKHWNWSLFKVDGRGVSAFARDRTGVFGEGASSFKLNLNDLKPYIAWKLGRFEAYLGWRERGNLGGSCRLHRKPKKE